MLEKYNGRNSRFTCPSCKQTNQFTRYIDTITGEYLADHVGICNRANNCGYHYSPKQYFNDNPDAPRREKLPEKRPDNYKKIISKKGEEGSIFSKVPASILDNSITNYNGNHFVTYLNTIFQPEVVQHLLNLYQIGTYYIYGSTYTIFWQIDVGNNVRTGKLISYNPQTGHRNKHKPTNWIHAVHPELKSANTFNLKQCLFGEHILSADSSTPVALVESEKTAVIAIGKLPCYLWLATGSLHEFKQSKLEILLGRRVVAFPDLGAYDRWQQKASTFSFKVDISNYLEIHATDEQRKEGLDIADFL
ncbi:MAG: hypothetical protein H8E34_04130 [Bacteroidetes bacterium]|nr:hypothetical protein [Bacteroidota bacterium]MBL6943223.1 hypothetical protein [Bacteroidales bacterium]